MKAGDPKKPWEKTAKKSKNKKSKKAKLAVKSKKAGAKARGAGQPGGAPLKRKKPKRNSG